MGPVDIIDILKCISRMEGNLSNVVVKSPLVKVLICAVEISCSVEWSMKKFYNLVDWLCVKESGMSVMGLKDFNVL